MFLINTAKRPEAPIAQTSIRRPSTPDVAVGEAAVVDVVLEAPLEVVVNVVLEPPLELVPDAVAVTEAADVDRVL